MLLPTMASAQCPDNNHPHMIELGLPSGTKWACCNVGASKPEDYGGYYAWGETTEKSTYSNINYLFWDGNSTSDIGKNIAGTQYDAATANWGSPWVMPSIDQVKELLDNCTSEWTTENGVNGRRFTGSNGASIFLPAAGNRWDDNLTGAGSNGHYWSSSLTESYQGSADGMLFTGGFAQLGDGSRYDGRSVRPVVASSSTSSGIAIDKTNFPDDNFRSWVLAQDYGQDGVLTEEEIAAVTEINVMSENISNLKGIEYFIALEVLHCESNQLTSLDVSNNTALTYLNCTLNQLTSLDVSNNTALTGLYCNWNQLTSLDVSKNTALTKLECYGNQLTSLDVSKNSALTELYCYWNQLTTLDVSKNTALSYFNCLDNYLTSLDVSKNTVLTYLECSYNQLTSLDVSKNTALTYFYCYGNQLTSLDVSKNTALTYLNCGWNQLTSLDVSKNTALTQLDCYNNQIKGTAMDALIAGLPRTGGDFYAIYPDRTDEQNVVTKAQVAAAKEKGWTTYYWNNETRNWEEYAGSDEQTISPVDEGEVISIGDEIDANTNLDGNVVGDVYFNINDGSYNASEGCIVVNSPTDDSFINGQDIFGDDFKEGYNGIVFMVPAGKGTVKVEAQTTGTMVLKVKIGDNDPVEMELEGRLKMSFPYNVSEDTYVYIYGGTSGTGAKGIKKASGSGSLKIFGIEVAGGENSLDNLTISQLDNSPVYNLNGQRVSSSPLGRPGGVPTKGVYIRNGKKVLVK